MEEYVNLCPHETNISESAKDFDINWRRIAPIFPEGSLATLLLLPEKAEENEPRGYAVQKTVNAVLAVLSVVLFFLTQPLVWRFRFVDWWTVLFVLLCGTALAMLIWKRKEENKVEETDEEETEDFAE